MRLSVSRPACKELRSHHSQLATGKMFNIAKSTVLRTVGKWEHRVKCFPPNWREENRKIQVKVTYQQKPKGQERLQEMEVLSETLLEAQCRQAGGVKTPGRPSHLREAGGPLDFCGFWLPELYQVPSGAEKTPPALLVGGGKMSLLKTCQGSCYSHKADPQETLRNQGYPAGWVLSKPNLREGKNPIPAFPHLPLEGREIPSCSPLSQPDWGGKRWEILVKVTVQKRRLLKDGDLG